MYTIYRERINFEFNKRGAYETKKIIPLLFIVTLLSMILIIFGWHKNNISYGFIKAPSKIILYYYGEQKEVIRTVEPNLFTDVCRLIGYQMPDMIGVDIISDTEIDEVKTYAVEYIYNKPQNIKIYTENEEKQIQYTEVLFGAGGEYEDCVYIKTTDHTYLFIDVIGDIKYLVRNAF